MLFPFRGEQMVIAGYSRSARRGAVGLAILTLAIVAVMPVVVGNALNDGEPGVPLVLFILAPASLWLAFVAVRSLIHVYRDRWAVRVEDGVMQTRLLLNRWSTPVAEIVDVEPAYAVAIVRRRLVARVRLRSGGSFDVPVALLDLPGEAFAARVLALRPAH